MMVKLTGPGLAQDAAGSIAETLTFSTWKGKSYLKQHRAPKQPRSPPQLAMRAIMGFLSGEWDQISAADKGTWLGMAQAAEISPFNAYQRENLSRWRRFLRPSEAHPAAEGGAHGHITAFGAAGIPRGAELTYDIRTLAQNWGMQIHHVTGDGADLHWYDLIHLEPLHTQQIETVLLQDLTPGLTWFAFTMFTTTGKLLPGASYRSATIGN